MAEQYIDQFHFLRPLWLLVIPLAIVLGYRLRRQYKLSDQWRGAIASDLLIHLTVTSDSQKRIRPYHMITTGLIVASLAMAGPTWQREITPFTEDSAPLIVALELTPGMLGVDQQPTRLDRARHKIIDILEQRKGARTALIGYAGSAHAVLPFTDDAQLIEIYLESLSPELMPKQGDDATLALELARTMLEGEQTPATIIFMTDGIDRTLAPSFLQFSENSERGASLKDQVLILGFGTESGGPIDSDTSGNNTFGLQDGQAPGIDLVGLTTVAKAVGSSLIRTTTDSSDVESLMRKTRSNLVNTLQQDEKQQWRDAGYVLVWPLALIILLWTRRGWTIRWR